MKIKISKLGLAMRGTLINNIFDGSQERPSPIRTGGFDGSNPQIVSRSQKNLAVKFKRFPQASGAQVQTSSSRRYLYDADDI